MRLPLCFFALSLAVALCALPTRASAQSGDTLDALTGESGSATQVTGFGVAGFHADGRTGDNSFDAGKLAVGVFRELNQRVWVFGQLTTSFDPAASGPTGEATTTIEIDDLIVNMAPSASVQIMVGKFDTPLGFERDDEPLNLQPTTSNNFELARPPKLVGVLGRVFLTRTVDLSGWVANGWEGDLETNHGKTVGGRLGIRPSERGSLGIGFLYGPELAQGPSDLAQGASNRYLLNLDYAVQPTSRWIVGGEANLGGDRRSGDAGNSRWYGATATVFRQLADRFGISGRIDRFNDSTGARTGTPQSLTSFSIAPMYFVGVGGNGVFATVDRTTFRIPRFQIRGEARWDQSTAAVFDAPAGPDTWTLHYVVQLVATF